jgi:hypothetical protein
VDGWARIFDLVFAKIPNKTNIVFMQNITVMEAKTEERPFYYEFKKSDFVNFNPTMANLNYDPFPDKDLDDIVRREILCREVVLRAKLKGEDVISYRPSVAVVIDGHKFAITSAEINCADETSDIEGSEFLGECEPLKTLARLREIYAASNR